MSRPPAPGGRAQQDTDGIASLRLDAAEVVCFDLDGCLVDSRSAIATCINLGLDAVGVPTRPPTELHALIGPPLLESFRSLLVAAGRDPDIAPRCVDAYRDAYPDIARTHTTVVEGVAAELEVIGRDRVLAVVTSKPTPFARPIVDHVGLASHFAAVHGPELDELVEPKSVTLRRALEDVAPTVDPSRVVMVGDRYHDIDAGRACGCATIGVTWGIGAADELGAADLVVDRPVELTRALRSGCR